MREARRTAPLGRLLPAAFEAASVAARYDAAIILAAPGAAPVGLGSASADRWRGFSRL